LPAPEPLAAELRRQIAAAQLEQRAPSVAAAVVRDGEVIWADAVGLADAESGEEATPDHQYRIGSITKSFTAAGIMQLHEAGKLDLDDRLDAHLPGIEHGTLPIRRLLAHASGLQREIPGDVWETLVFPDGEELVGLMGEAERVLGPGERYHYSNLAFSLLGEVISRLSGKPYEQYVEERIIAPVGLKRTTFERTEPAATPYFVDPYADVVHPEPLVDKAGSVAAAGSLWSTAADLTGWAAFLADPNEDVLSKASIDAMSSVQVMEDNDRWDFGYGLGLQLSRAGDRVLVGHSGGMPGFLSNVSVSRKEKIGAVVLASSSANIDPQSIAAKLALTTIDQFALAPDPWRPSAAAPPDLAGVLGRWWTEGEEFVFRFRDGKLEARWTQAPEWADWSVFEPLGDDRFRTTQGRERGELLRIVRDPDGTPTRMYWATYPVTRSPETFFPK
jgi:CubicO group peptidase (beta-lactamase class C family)